MGFIGPSMRSCEQNRTLKIGVKRFTLNCKFLNDKAQHFNQVSPLRWCLKRYECELIKATGIDQIEVKFDYLFRTAYGEGMWLGLVSRRGSNVRGSKMIRYHPSLNRQRCWREIVSTNVSSQAPWETSSVRVPGGVLSQVWNLKELTEIHHQAWILRLKSTQHGKPYQVRI